jgi:hypothetical protein
MDIEVASFQSIAKLLWPLGLTRGNAGCRKDAERETGSMIVASVPRRRDFCPDSL